MTLPYESGYVLALAGADLDRWDVEVEQQTSTSREQWMVFMLVFYTRPDKGKACVLERGRSVGCCEAVESTILEGATRNEQLGRP